MTIVKNSNLSVQGTAYRSGQPGTAPGFSIRVEWSSTPGKPLQQPPPAGVFCALPSVFSDQMETQEVSLGRSSPQSLGFSEDFWDLSGLSKFVSFLNLDARREYVMKANEEGGVPCTLVDVGGKGSTTVRIPVVEATVKAR